MDRQRFDRGESDGGTDGYYFRDEGGKLRGPLTRFAYEAWSLRGAIKPGTKVWRQQGCNHYKIEITRKVRWRKLLSPRGCGAALEWVMMCSTVLSLAFLCTLRKLREEMREELRGHTGTTVFFVVLFLATILMTLATVRKLSGRVAVEASDLVESEV